MLYQRAVGAALPDYEVGAELGAGGFGVVYAVRHRALGWQRAVKVLTVPQRDDDQRLRFRREAQVMESLDHPHVARVYDYVERDGLSLIVMEYLAGGSLGQRAAEFRRRPEEISALGLAVADALDAAHTQDVVHRDIKPPNLLFTADGTVKVTDFGIAKLLLGPDGELASILAYTPGYAAPEQLTAGIITPRTDVYALAATLLGLFTGEKPPLPGDREQLRVALTVVPDRLAGVLGRALAPRAEERPEGAGAFALELADAAGRTFGVGWLDRAGTPFRGTDRVRAAANPSVTPASTLVAEAPRKAGPTVKATLFETAGRPADVLTVDTGLVRSVAFHPAGDVLATGGYGAVLRWDPRTGRPSGSPLASRGLGFVPSLAFSPDGSLLAISAGYDNTVRLWDATTGRPRGPALAGHSKLVTAVAFSPNGALLATASQGGTLRRWDATTGEPFGAPINGEGFTGLAFSPDGSRLATAGLDGTVRLWSVRTGGQVGEPLAGHAGAVRAVAFSPDGLLLATAGEDRTVRLWRAANGEPIGRPLTARTIRSPLRGHTKPVNAVAFSPDGTLLASASDGTTRLWDPRTRRQVGEPLTGHTAPVRGVAFSPDGTRLATASDDKTVRLWTLIG